MSPELQESLAAIVADCKELLAARIAEARGLTPERAAELAGSGFLSVRAATEAGLINRAGYFEDLRAEFDPERKERVFVGFARYLRRLGYARQPGRDPRLALIHGVGPVVAGEPPAAGDFLSGEAVAAQFHRAAADKSVRAIVFRVNSPGGSALGSDLVWRALGEARERGKPVVVSMGTWRDRAATTSRWARIESSLGRPRSPARSAWSMRASTPARRSRRWAWGWSSSKATR